jgi:hyperosmotically inducible periplasmic protein
VSARIHETYQNLFPRLPFLSEFKMKIQKKSFVLVAAIVAMVSALPAFSQTNDATAASATQPSKKTLRKQNRKLEMTVRRALTNTKNLESAGITVLAKGSVVTLDGTVPSDDQIPVAATVAGGVPGVTSVTNNLTMRETGH